MEVSFLIYIDWRKTMSQTNGIVKNLKYEFMEELNTDEIQIGELITIIEDQNKEKDSKR